MENGMFNQIITASDMMNIVPGFSTSSEKNMMNVWKSVVSKIKSPRDDDNEKRMPIGERLAGNTRVVDLKNGILLIETDHSGWIQYLKLYENFIIKGLKMALPDLKITSLAFRLAGTNAGLSETYEKSLSSAREQFSKKLDEQEKELKKYDSKKNQSENQGKSELPQELLDKFDSIRKSIQENE